MKTNKKSNKYKKKKPKNKSIRNKRKKQIMSLLQKAEKKITRTYVINESIYKQFKDVAEKDMRKLSNIIQQSIIRYINSKS